jgi:hypothetical protein
VLLKIVYLLIRRRLGLILVLARGGFAAAAEMLVLRHEMRCCAGMSTGCGTPRRAGPGSVRWHRQCPAGGPADFGRITQARQGGLGPSRCKPNVGVWAQAAAAGATTYMVGAGRTLPAKGR